MRIARFKLLGEEEARTGSVEGDRIACGGESYRLGDVRLLPPCAPTKIVCVGRNYAAHAKELGNDLPAEPLLFFKPPSAVIGPNEAIRLPGDGEVHYEAELALVIEERCRNVPENSWRDVVLGFTCLNDISDRTAQAWETNWVRAKGFDTSAPMGPWIVTPDEADEPFRVSLRVNGELRQDASTDLLLFGLGRLVQTISAIMTLEPGDVIATGTPAGVGPLATGDLVEVEIDKIGVLANHVLGKE